MNISKLSNIRVRAVLWLVVGVPIAYWLFHVDRRNYMYAISAACFAIALGELIYLVIRRLSRSQ